MLPNFSSMILKGKSASQIVNAQVLQPLLPEFCSLLCYIGPIHCLWLFIGAGSLFLHVVQFGAVW